MITEKQIIEAQENWGKSIIEIGKVFSEKGDYVEAAKKHIQRFYAYDYGAVLFKPTLALKKPFRLNFEAALSYFIAGNKDFPEDVGFALRPWKSVIWKNEGVVIKNNMAAVMGTYIFKDFNDEKAEVQFSLNFVDFDGELKMVLHHSAFACDGS
jgi:hypothetical protein